MAEIVEHQRQVGKSTHTPNLTLSNYSPSTKETYLAPLPAGYAGEFGPGIKALTLVFYYASQMSEPKILEFYSENPVQAAWLMGLRSTS